MCAARQDLMKRQLYVAAANQILTDAALIAKM